MNKKGLMGKILLIILAVVLVIGIYLGFTAYQAYSTIKSIQSEQPLIESDINALQQGDCTKISAIEDRMGNVQAEAESACKNPLIKYLVGRMQQVPIKCENVSSLTAQMNTQLEPIKQTCANQTAA